MKEQTLSFFAWEVLQCFEATYGDNTKSGSSFDADAFEIGFKAPFHQTQQFLDASVGLSVGVGPQQGWAAAVCLLSAWGRLNIVVTLLLKEIANSKCVSCHASCVRATNQCNKGKPAWLKLSPVSRTENQHHSRDEETAIQVVDLSEF